MTNIINTECYGIWNRKANSGHTPRNRLSRFRFHLLI